MTKKTKLPHTDEHWVSSSAWNGHRHYHRKICSCQIKKKGFYELFNAIEYFIFVINIKYKNKDMSSKLRSVYNI